MEHDDIRRRPEGGYAAGHTTSHSSSGGQAIFSDIELDKFWEDDTRAATAVVGLLAGIFSIGLLGYIAVSLWVWSQPHI